MTATYSDYLDRLAAAVFVLPLDRATTDSMTRLVLRRALSGQPCPPIPTTRVGLAFLAFATRINLVGTASNGEIAWALERAARFWTAQEQKRIDQMIDACRAG